MATSQNKSSANNKSAGRPARVWAAIILLVIVIASIFYFNRETPIPKELKEMVSAGNNTDSVWTYNHTDTNSISLKTPSGAVFSLSKSGEGISSFTMNGKAIREMDKYVNEIAVLINELRKRNSQQ